MYINTVNVDGVTLYGALCAGKGQVVKLCRRIKLSVRVPETTKHSVVNDRRTSLPLATLSG